jgi:hypothetical protein
MPDLTRPWLSPSEAPGISFIKPTEHWCVYGKHTFTSTSRTGSCCPTAACREKRKEAQRESNRKSRERRKARECAN